MHLHLHLQAQLADRYVSTKPPAGRCFAQQLSETRHFSNFAREFFLPREYWPRVCREFAERYEASLLSLEQLTPHQRDVLEKTRGKHTVQVRAAAGTGRE